MLAPNTQSTALTVIDSDCDAAEIGRLYREAKQSLIESVRYQIECGYRLTVKKKKLKEERGHGSCWLTWLEINADTLGFKSRQTASRLMAGWESWRKCYATDEEANGALTHHLNNLDPVHLAQINRQAWGNVDNEDPPPGNPQDPTPRPTLDPHVATLVDAAMQVAGSDVVLGYIRGLKVANTVSLNQFKQAARAVEQKLGRAMKAFWTYLGGKHNLARRLGRPRYEHVIETFAGSAGFSCYWAPQQLKRVTLVECDPVVAGVWKYLIHASAREILALPANIQSIEEIPHLPQEVRWLIGFWFDHGLRLPGKSRSKRARRPSERAFFWSETIKHRLAHQVERIRHWEIIEGDYHDAPDVAAHWHVDPPYETTNKNLYRCNAIDYAELAAWCRSRRGFIQVCEHGDADWLPFRQYAMPVNRFRTGVTSEAVYEAAQ